MPNWCTNHMIISGDKQLISELANKIIRKDPDNNDRLIFDFEGIFPTPEVYYQEVDSMLAAAAEIFIFKPSFVLSENELTKSNFGLRPIYPWLYEALHQYLSPLCNWDKVTVSEAEALIRSDDSGTLQKNCKVDIGVIDRLRRNVEQYGYIDWYNWRVSNWGTKWNACESCVTVTDENIDVCFETAWAPPEGIYRAICEAYPDLQLTARFIEEGMWFAGEYNSCDRFLHETNCEDDEVKAFGTKYFSLEWEEDEEDGDSD